MTRKRLQKLIALANASSASPQERETARRLIREYQAQRQRVDQAQQRRRVEFDARLKAVIRDALGQQSQKYAVIIAEQQKLHAEELDRAKQLFRAKLDIERRYRRIRFIINYVFIILAHWIVFWAIWFVLKGKK